MNLSSSQISELLTAHSDDKINLICEQIQQDILSFASVIDDEKIFLNDKVLEELCQIVVDNFEAFNK